jgi:uncharacterized protein (DUF1778 family)
MSRRPTPSSESRDKPLTGMLTAAQHADVVRAAKICERSLSSFAALAVHAEARRVLAVHETAPALGDNPFAIAP